ncbi:MAG: ATP-binding protein [Microscillaceae bacterium]|nr:ATP-binding protein [Microscillaceae bacterium]
MKIKRYFKYFYLLLALITLSGAFLLNSLRNHLDRNATDNRLKKYQNQINRRIEQMDSKRNVAIQHMQEKGIYAVLQENSTEDLLYYLFKEEKLILWSDYRFVPAYDQLKGTYQFSFLEIPQGQFVLSKTNFYLENEPYELYILLPIFWKYKIENAYLKSGFNPSLIDDDRLLISKKKQAHFLPIFARQEYLFSIAYKITALDTSSHIQLWIILFTGLGFIFLGRFLKYVLAVLKEERQYELAFVLLAAYLLGLRYLALVYNFPQSVYKGLLFDSKLYASSFFSPSVGDLLLNILLLGILTHYLLIYRQKSLLYRHLLKASRRTKYIVSFSLLGLSFVTINAFFYVMSTIFLHSKINLDIARKLDLNVLGLFGVLIFIFTAILGFMILHFLMRLVIQLSPAKKLEYKQFLVVSLLTCLAVYYGWYFLWGEVHWFVNLVGFLYFLVLRQLEFPRFLYKYSYISLIYMIVGSLCFSIVGAYTIYHFGMKKRIEDKHKFAGRLLPESDEMAEFLLGNAIKEIKKDSLVKAFFISQISNKDSLQVSKGDTTATKPKISLNDIQQSIKKRYLFNHFDKYQINLLFFEVSKGSLIGADLPGTEEDYDDYEENYKKIYYETNQEDLFFISKSGVNLIKQYLAFIEIEDKSDKIGNLIIDLRQKRAEPTRVYPELLVDKNYTQALETRDYSYAVYDNNQVVYSLGSFNYEKNFDLGLFQEDGLFTRGIIYKGFEHLAVDGVSTKRVLVSSEKYGFTEVFSNFSFLFLLLITCVVGLIVVYSLTSRIRQVKVNFATRIQVYLNIAFFLPLFTVSITTLSIISRTYQEDLKRSFISKTEGVAVNILPQLENLQNQKISTIQFSKTLSEIAQYAGVDINVFDESGYLLGSSQPSIYETALISPYVNALALYSIRQENNIKVLLNESVGKLKYQSVYVPVKSYETGRLLGIVSIPFFDSQYELNDKLLKVLSTIINIFISIFIVFIVLSYFASQILTVPLRLITQKIKKTTFYNYNEALEWNSKDEIGLFVEEYNRMLRKLDKSKEALVRSQKESAWREIAQQVAHEIKNPLTPMKLTLQHMQVRLQNQGEKIRSMFERSFDVLLTQVETLSDIATSFSSFAKMPIPTSERFEISEVLKDSQSLYSNEDADIVLSIEQGKFFVRGDKRLMGRIFTNLIKNAIEAIPDDRNARIEIYLSAKVEGLVLLEFRDNGSGVTKDVQDKIFMPNFSTKSTGSGIGLAVAKRGIEHAGGRIWFETEENIGTSFFIELPLIE